MENRDFFEINNCFEAQKNVDSVLLYGKRNEDVVVSIMIPTYLRNDYLIDTLDSAMKQKTEVSYEIIVVDNNSDFNDNRTLRIIENYDESRVCYYKNTENLGMFGNWNRCIELSNAPWLLILHDDDMISNNYIECMLAVIKNNPHVVGIGCLFDYIDENSKLISFESVHSSPIKDFIKKKITRYSYRVITSDFYYLHPINIMGFFLNKKAAFTVGGFENIWYPTSDYIFLLNLSTKGQIRCVSEKLLLYRQAVNSSLSVKHLIGMVEIDAYMRKCINEKLHIKSPRKDLYYRSAVILQSERFFQNRWFGNLSEEDMDKVIKEYNCFNHTFEVAHIPNLYNVIIKFEQYLRSTWMKFFRRG